MREYRVRCGSCSEADQVVVQWRNDIAERPGHRTKVRLAIRHKRHRYVALFGSVVRALNRLPAVQVTGSSQNCYYRPYSQPPTHHPPTRKRASSRCRPQLTTSRRASTLMLLRTGRIGSSTVNGSCTIRVNSCVETELLLFGLFKPTTWVAGQRRYRARVGAALRR
jgi:hypothetical protein